MFGNFPEIQGNGPATKVARVRLRTKVAFLREDVT
jgi:hypothetical protein